MDCADSIGDFLSVKGGFYFEQSQPDRFRYIALDASDIDDAPSEHLVSAADSHQPSARATMPRNEILPAVGAHPFQIGDRAFGPRNDQDIEAWRNARVAQVMNGDIRLSFEWLEIRVVGDARQMYHSNRQRLVHP